MNWTLDFKKKARKFLTKQPYIEKEVINEITKLLRLFNGEVVSIDFRALKGEWEGHHRIRKGKIRIVVKIDSDNEIVHIHDIDFRGNIYSK
jgi:mRNA interferase RelE/StbE